MTNHLVVIIHSLYHTKCVSVVRTMETDQGSSANDAASSQQCLKLTTVQATNLTMKPTWSMICAVIRVLKKGEA